MLKALWVGFLALLFYSPTIASVAEKPILGGLGTKFHTPLDPAALGSTIERTFHRPDNRPLDIPPIVPGEPLAWRIYLNANLPRLFRDLVSKNYVMINQRAEPLRLVSEVAYVGCGQEYQWLKETLIKKYSVVGDVSASPSMGFAEAFRITFSGYQIDVQCGKHLWIEYGDYSALATWAKNNQQAYALYQREQKSIEKRKIVLERRRAVHFADTFTLGDQYRLAGAFGIAFKQPFAEKSTQKFPIDRPFIAVLPVLPEKFEDGEISLEIAPDRVPIVIRGTFIDLAFEQVADALKAKFGTPMKATDRHVIHKVGNNRAILKRLNTQQIELAFIDTEAKTEQRQRLWEQESDGL